MSALKRDSQPLLTFAGYPKGLSFSNNDATEESRPFAALRVTKVESSDPESHRARSAKSARQYRDTNATPPRHKRDNATAYNILITISISYLAKKKIAPQPER
jgi:hypothetical protein